GLQSPHVINPALDQFVCANIPSVKYRSFHGAGGLFCNRLSFVQILPDSHERNSSRSAQIKLKYAQTRQSALVELRGGAGTLSALEVETSRLATRLEAKIPQLARTHAQALADHREGS